MTSFPIFTLVNNSTGSLTTRNTFGLKGCVMLSHVSGDDWGLVGKPSSLPASLDFDGSQLSPSINETKTT